MEQETIVEEAKRRLGQIETALPLYVNEVTNPDDPTVVARINKADGYPVLAPHPESFAMLTGQREFVEFFVFAPRLIRGLLDEIESRKGVAQPEK